MKQLQYKNKEGQWISIPILGGVGDVTQEDIVNFIDSVKYNEETQEIEFYHGESIIDTLDVTPFLVDNFVKEVEIIGTDLVITFNTEDKPAIRVSLEKIFNPENYYTKEEIEEKFDEALYEEGFDANGYDYVDMGDAGIWCTHNVGATKPEEYGLYFQWADTKGWTREQVYAKEKSFYWGSYKYCFNGYEKSMKKYCNSISYGPIVDNLLELEPKDDAASVNMGGDWRMPTKEDFQKLYDLCDIEFVSDYNQTGINGILLTLKTDSNRKIFFSAASRANNSQIENSIFGNSYWSRSLDTSAANRAHSFSFYDDIIQPQSRLGRYYGVPIRAFISPTKSPKYLTKQQAGETYATKEEVKKVSDKLEEDLKIAIPYPANNQVIYVSTDGEKLELYENDNTKDVISNEYKHGFGIITYKNNLLQCPGLYSSIKSPDKLKKVVLPNCIASLEGTFSGTFPNLIEVNIPSSVTELPDECFSYLTGLEHIYIPSHITVIPQKCFYKCYNLKEINLYNITEIGYEAFYNCESLESVNLINVETLAVDSFYGCISLKTVKFGKKLTSIPMTCFYNCCIDVLNIPSNIKSIGYNAFYTDVNTFTYVILNSKIEGFSNMPSFNDSKVLNWVINYNNDEILNLATVNINGFNVKNIYLSNYKEHRQAFPSYVDIIKPLYGTVKDIVHFDDIATTQQSGAMSADDKTKLDTLWEFYNSFPSDNQVVAVVNRKAEPVAPAGYDLIYRAQTTAASLALESLNNGVLVTTGADEEMIEEMKTLLGDDIFNELAAKSVQTMELRPQPSIEEQIEQAKGLYLARKAEQAEYIKSIMENIKGVEEGNSLDVEPDNNDVI